MPPSFYLRRFAIAFVVAATTISVAQMLKGHPPNLAVPDGLLWGAVTSTVYVLVLARKLRSCPVPRADPPDSVSSG